MRHCTNAENIKAEALVNGLVDELIWEAVKAHMTCQGKGTDSFILRKKSYKQIISKMQWAISVNKRKDLVGADVKDNLYSNLSIATSVSCFIFLRWETLNLHIGFKNMFISRQFPWLVCVNARFHSKM